MAKIKRLTFKDIVLKLCRKDRGKRGTDVAQMTEILGDFAEFYAGMSLYRRVQLLGVLSTIGRRRLLRKKCRRS